jgi:Helix-turn-helix domain
MLSAGAARSVTLVDLLDDPERVKDVAREQIPALLVRLSALEIALAARLEELTTCHEPMGLELKDRLLTPEEAAVLLGVSPASLRRNWRRYRFARKLSRKTLRFSETGLRRWIATKMVT